MRSADEPSRWPPRSWAAQPTSRQQWPSLESTWERTPAYGPKFSRVRILGIMNPTPPTALNRVNLACDSDPHNTMWKAMSRSRRMLLESLIVFCTIERWSLRVSGSHRFKRFALHMLVNLSC